MDVTQPPDLSFWPPKPGFCPGTVVCPHSDEARHTGTSPQDPSGSLPPSPPAPHHLPWARVSGPPYDW